MTFTKILLLAFLILQINTLCNAQSDENKFTKGEILNAIESLDQNKAVGFELFTSAFKSRIFPYFNDQITAQLLFSKKQPWMDKASNGRYQYDQDQHRHLLAKIISQPRHSCIAQTLVSLDKVLRHHNKHFINVIDRRYQRELDEAHQAQEWKKQAEKEGREYYGRDPNPNPRSLYEKVSFELTADYSRQMELFWMEFKKWQKDKENNINPIESGFSIDLYLEPIKNFTYLYSDNNFELKWYKEALEKSGFKNWADTKCTVTPEYLAFKLGMRAGDVEKGYLPPKTAL